MSLLDSDVDAARVNNAMQFAASTDLGGILGVTGDSVVSSDIKGMWESAVVDLSCTHVVAKLACGGLVR